MEGSLSHPRLSRNQQNTQICYELQHRIHTAKTYPVQSPNGSTVIIYGHENGVRVVWRGGRKFKVPQVTSAAPKKANGSEDAIILLDSDDEVQSSGQPFQDKPEFEDEEEEFDPSKPYPGILQVLDLYFGTDALHLALLPQKLLQAEGGSLPGLESLKDKIVFTAACADSSVRLVNLPLTPPSLESKSRPDFSSNFTLANAGNMKWGETVIHLLGHQKPADGVAMTVEFSSSPRKDQSKSEPKSSAIAESSIVIASHSREVTGQLLLYRVPIISTSTKHQFEPFQKIYLSAPATQISFTPAVSGQSSSQLLVADTAGTCRIYDHRILVKDSTPEDPPSDSLVAEQGTWLLSLYPGFQNTKNDPQSFQVVGADANCGRKTIVDAKWISGGSAIIVLLNDGEWAIWDIEGVGPGSSRGLLGRQGIKGGSLSQFSVTGYIEGAVKAPLARSSAPSHSSGSKFAPMTPGTRKSTDPFSSRTQNGLVRGQISVVEIPSNSPSNPIEESVLIWFGESFVIIPNIAKYWAASGRKGTGGSGNLFNNNTGGSRKIKVEGVNLHGERCSGIDQIAHISSPSGLSSEILIIGEHRFIVLSFSKHSSQTQASVRLALVERDTNNGELDVVGIDQALTRMENGNNWPKSKAIQR